MGLIIFNGNSSLDYGIQVEKPPDHSMPEKDYEIIHIPGKNGDLILDKGSYQNVDRSYNIAVGTEISNFITEAIKAVSWLHSASGYARLEDSYEPDYYRMASYIESATLANILQRAGRATVTFNCKPQCYLKDGENVLTFSENSTLVNPTIYTALPEITVYCDGDGVLRIGEHTITLSSIDGHITINSEIQDAYKGTENCNSSVALSSGYPMLILGENEIAFSGDITSVDIIPNWWTL